VIAGERADESACELPAERGLETFTSLRTGLDEPAEARAVVEQAADGLAVGGRRCGCNHGTLVIGGL
jgi:hypothetical protein